MVKIDGITRIERIRLDLRRGDKKEIADMLGVSPEWVSRVIRGEGSSEPVLQAAERFTARRKQEMTKEER